MWLKIYRSVVVVAYVLATTLTSEAATAVQPAESGLSEKTRARILTVQFRVEPRFGEPRDACVGLAPDDLTIRLRGERLEPSRIVSLSRDVRPMVHALLIDASGSMEDKLEAVREAALRYIDRLRPGLDLGLVATFDDDPLLAAPITDDRAALARAVRRIAVGGGTSLYDALDTIVRELSSRIERPVVVLLSDGADTTSVATRGDVFELVRERPDLAVFPIGLALPEIQRGPGTVTPKKFLQLLAHRTDGEFLDIPTPSRVAGAYDRVRDLLDAEWEIVITDPDPSAEDAEPVLRVTGRPCALRVLGRRGRPPAPGPARDDVGPVEDETVCGPPPSWVPRQAVRLGPSIGAGWRSRLVSGGIQGCVVDLTTDLGRLYDADTVAGSWFNGWREIGARPFDLRVPRLDELPTTPADALEVVADALVAWSGPEPEPGPRLTRISRHARPFGDLPFVWNGRTVLAVRAEMAAALAEMPDYAGYARSRTVAEARRALDERAERLARATHGLSVERLRAALAESPEGREILARAEAPGPADLERNLAAWLGDVPVSEVFRAWETEAVGHILDGRTERATGFEERYRAAHHLFFAASYARILAPLVVGRDRSSGAVGFWRFVLPRSVWIESRKKNFDDEESRRIPMDLLPERPLGAWIAGKLARGGAGTALAPVELIYESLEPPRHLDPWRAFDHARVTLRLAGVAGGEVSIVAEVTQESDESDPVLESVDVRSSRGSVPPSVVDAIEAALLR